MSISAHIPGLTISLLLLAVAGPVCAASNSSALLGASEPVGLELSDSSMSNPTISTQRRPAVLSATAMGSAAPTKITAQRLPSRENRGFDWTTLVSLGFGVLGLLWVRRRSAEL